MALYALWKIGQPRFFIQLMLGKIALAAEGRFARGQETLNELALSEGTTTQLNWNHILEASIEPSYRY